MKMYCSQLIDNIMLIITDFNLWLFLGNCLALVIKFDMLEIRINIDDR